MKGLFTKNKIILEKLNICVHIHVCIILTNPRKNLFLKKAPQHPNVLMSRISAPSVVMT